MFRLTKPKIRLRLETAHVQPEASETLTQHRANPASTSRSDGLRPDYTHSVFAHHPPTVRLLGIPRKKQAPCPNLRNATGYKIILTNRGLLYSQGLPWLVRALDQNDSCQQQTPTPHTRDPRPPRRPRPGGNEGRGRKGRKKGKEGRRPPISTGGMGRYQGGFRCSLAQAVLPAWKGGGASVGIRLMAAAEHTLPY